MLRRARGNIAAQMTLASCVLGAVLLTMTGALLVVLEREADITDRVRAAGDTALVSNRWRLTGATPDGTPVEMAGTSADVLRKRPDGTWGIVIDDPWGSAA